VALNLWKGIFFSNLVFTNWAFNLENMLCDFSPINQEQSCKRAIDDDKILLLVQLYTEKHAVRICHQCDDYRLRFN
jgi:hypothetical protein